MQAVQRRFGKLLPRTADESQVAVLLKDFDDADRMLFKIIEASKAWRDSWRDILNTQQRLAQGFQSIYAPIIGAGEEYEGHVPIITDEATMARTEKLQTTFDDLRTDLLQEINTVDTTIIQPAMDARNFIQPLKKTIKKREDRKLDFEKYQTRVDNARKKTKRSERDNASLDKAEQDLLHAKEDYKIADEHLRSTLPAVITAAFSILPHLLSAQIMTQNSLLGHYYTTLHDYCDEERFPNPPAPAPDIISTWDTDFKPIKQQVETGLACIAGGKAAHRPMRLEDKAPPALRNGSASSLNPRRPSGNALRAPSSPAVSASSGPPSPDASIRPRISSVPSQTSLSLATPNYNSSAVVSPSSDASSHAPAGPRADYFSRERMPSNSSLASIAAAKKKPPPPPPPKRTPSAQGFWVTAMYDFAGEGDGDLAFREGDRIRVVKRTDSTDDWWEGDLRGVQGSFPANYCQPV